MHELKIIQDIFPIIEAVAKNNNLTHINKVSLKIGALRQIQSDFLQFAFNEVAKGTVAAGAELGLEIIPVTIYCATCKQKSVVTENMYVCPECGNIDIEIITGKELVIASVDGSNDISS